MPDLTSAQLIALLREHPLSRKAIAVDFTEYEVDDVEITTPDIGLVTTGCPKYKWIHLRVWLTGALVEAHVERELPFPTQWCDLKWSSGKDAGSKPLSEWTKHETLLHALLAGLESNLKETTNG